MKLVKPEVKLINTGYDLVNVYRQVEQCSRTCYKSETQIDDSSYVGFIDNLIKRGHTAMLEHGTIYLQFFWNGAVCSFCDQTLEDNHIDKYLTNPYSKVAYNGNDVYITTNLRVIHENGWEDDLKYMVNPSEYHHKRHTFKIITDRATSMEILRHRKMSFAQESTRFCNYSKGRFGGELTFIIPSWAKIDEGSYTNRAINLKQDKDVKSVYIIPDKASSSFADFMCQCEREYLDMIDCGLIPEQARQVLPNALKTEICVTGFTEDWQHFLDLRLYDKTGRSHPDIKFIAKEIMELLKM